VIVTVQHGATFDSSSWPLVRIEFVDVSDRVAVTRFNASFDALFARKSVFGVVLHAASNDAPPPIVRRAIADYQRERQELSRRYIAGFAFVAGPLQAVVLTAIRWLVPAYYPEETFGKKPDAEAWVRKQLARAGAL
jgi:hypothetical protein